MDSLKQSVQNLMSGSMKANQRLKSDTSVVPRPSLDAKKAEQIISSNSNSRRDELLHKLPEPQQIELLKFAESHGISQQDPMWILVDMLGYTQRMTDTLPKKMYAAGQQAVEAIAQQRTAESEAFAFNAFNTLDKMLAQIT